RRAVREHDQESLHGYPSRKKVGVRPAAKERVRGVRAGLVDVQDVSGRDSDGPIADDRGPMPLGQSPQVAVISRDLAQAVGA
ncbi:hypothetical protein, partial [Kitasatospora sp. MY 5-36]|uniref:hypothetical protein n=1 Tax=Kitasatospora sp. MY 5-36 TaxID=1678027 RepID=UPI001F3133D6